MNKDLSDLLDWLISLEVIPKTIAFLRRMKLYILGSIFIAGALWVFLNFTYIDAYNWTWYPQMYGATQFQTFPLKR